MPYALDLDKPLAPNFLDFFASYIPHIAEQVIMRRAALGLHVSEKISIFLKFQDGKVLKLGKAIPHALAEEIETVIRFFAVGYLRSESEKLCELRV